MENKPASIRRFMITTGVVLLVAGLISACDKDDDNDNRLPSAGLMAFNLAPDQNAVGIALSGSQLTNAPLAYTSFNGTYQNIYVGPRDIASFDYNLDSTLATSNVTFEDSAFYSLFVVGNNGVYKNITVRDDIDSSSSVSLAHVRYINAIPDSSAPVVTITSGGEKPVDAPAKFTEVSPFIPVAGGDVNIAVSNGNTISANRTITLENGKVYTALLVGVPGATDTAKAVQIRYIVNGAVPAVAEQ